MLLMAHKRHRQEVWLEKYCNLSIFGPKSIGSPSVSQPFNEHISRAKSVQGMRSISNSVAAEYKRRQICSKKKERGCRSRKRGLKKSSSFEKKIGPAPNFYPFDARPSHAQHGRKNLGKYWIGLCHAY